MADWNSVPEDFGSVGVDYANLHSENLLAKSDFTDEHKDELVQLGEKLGVSVDSSLELSEKLELAMLMGYSIYHPTALTLSRP